MNILKKLFGRKKREVANGEISRYLRTGIFNKFVSVLVTVCFVISIVNLPAFAAKKKSRYENKEQVTEMKEKGSSQDVSYMGDESSGSVSYMQSLSSNIEVKDGVIYKKGKNGKKNEAIGTWDGEKASIMDGEGKLTENSTYTEAVNTYLGKSNKSESQIKGTEEAEEENITEQVTGEVKEKKEETVMVIGLPEDKEENIKTEISKEEEITKENKSEIVKGESEKENVLKTEDEDDDVFNDNKTNTNEITSFDNATESLENVANAATNPWIAGAKYAVEGTKKVVEFFTGENDIDSQTQLKGDEEDLISGVKNIGNQPVNDKEDIVTTVAEIKEIKDEIQSKPQPQQEFLNINAVYGENAQEIFDKISEQTGLTTDQIYNELQKAGVTKEQFEKVSATLISQLSNGAKIINCSASALYNAIGDIASIGGILSVGILAIQQLAIDIVSGTFLQNNKADTKQIMTSMYAQQQVLSVYGIDSSGYECNLEDFMASLQPGENAIVWVNSSHYITVTKEEDGSFSVTDINVNDGNKVVYSATEFTKLINNQTAVGNDAETGTEITSNGYKAANENGKITVLTSSKTVAEKGIKLSEERMKAIAGADYKTITKTITISISFSITVPVPYIAWVPKTLKGLFGTYTIYVPVPKIRYVKKTIKKTIRKTITIRIPIPKPPKPVTNFLNKAKNALNGIKNGINNLANKAKNTINNLNKGINNLANNARNAINNINNAYKQNGLLGAVSSGANQLGGLGSRIGGAIGGGLGSRIGGAIGSFVGGVVGGAVGGYSNGGGILGAITGAATGGVLGLVSGANKLLGGKLDPVQNMLEDSVLQQDLDKKYGKGKYTIGRDNDGHQQIKDNSNNNKINIQDGNVDDSIKTLSRAAELGGTTDAKTGNVTLKNGQTLKNKDILNDKSYGKIKELNKGISADSDLTITQQNGQWGYTGSKISNGNGGGNGFVSFNDLVNSDGGIAGFVADYKDVEKNSPNSDLTVGVEKSSSGDKGKVTFYGSNLQGGSISSADLHAAVNKTDNTTMSTFFINYNEANKLDVPDSDKLKIGVGSDGALSWNGNKIENGSISWNNGTVSQLTGTAGFVSSYNDVCKSGVTDLTIGATADNKGLQLNSSTIENGSMPLVVNGGQLCVKDGDKLCDISTFSTYCREAQEAQVNGYDLQVGKSDKGEIAFKGDNIVNGIQLVSKLSPGALENYGEGYSVAAQNELTIGYETGSDKFVYKGAHTSETGVKVDASNGGAITAFGNRYKAVVDSGADVKFTEDGHHLTGANIDGEIDITTGVFASDNINNLKTFLDSYKQLEGTDLKITQCVGGSADNWNSAFNISGGNIKDSSNNPAHVSWGTVFDGKGENGFLAQYRLIQGGNICITVDVEHRPTGYINSETGETLKDSNGNEIKYDTDNTTFETLKQKRIEECRTKLNSIDTTNQESVDEFFEFCGYNKELIFTACDTDGDGKLTKNEAKKYDDIYICGSEATYGHDDVTHDLHRMANGRRSFINDNFPGEGDEKYDGLTITFNGTFVDSKGNGYMPVIVTSNGDDDGEVGKVEVWSFDASKTATINGKYGDYTVYGYETKITDDNNKEVPIIRIDFTGDHEGESAGFLKDNTHSIYEKGSDGSGGGNGSGNVPNVITAGIIKGNETDGWTLSGAGSQFSIIDGKAKIMGNGTRAYAGSEIGVSAEGSDGNKYTTKITVTSNSCYVFTTDNGWRANTATSSFKFSGTAEENRNFVSAVFYAQSGDTIEKGELDNFNFRGEYKGSFYDVAGIMDQEGITSFKVSGYYGADGKDGPRAVEKTTFNVSIVNRQFQFKCTEDTKFYVPDAYKNELGEETYTIEKGGYATMAYHLAQTGKTITVGGEKLTGSAVWSEYDSEGKPAKGAKIVGYMYSLTRGITCTSNVNDPGYLNKKTLDSIKGKDGATWKAGSLVNVDFSKNTFKISMGILDADDLTVNADVFNELTAGKKNDKEDQNTGNGKDKFDFNPFFNSSGIKQEGDGGQVKISGTFYFVSSDVTVSGLVAAVYASKSTLQKGDLTPGGASVKKVDEKTGKQTEEYTGTSKFDNKVQISKTGEWEIVDAKFEWGWDLLDVNSDNSKKFGNYLGFTAGQIGAGIASIMQYNPITMLTDFVYIVVTGDDSIREEREKEITRLAYGVDTTNKDLAAEKTQQAAFVSAVAVLAAAITIGTLGEGAGIAAILVTTAMAGMDAYFATIAATGVYNSYQAWQEGTGSFENFLLNVGVLALLFIPGVGEYLGVTQKITMAITETVLTKSATEFATKALTETLGKEAVEAIGKESIESAIKTSIESGVDAGVDELTRQVDNVAAEFGVKALTSTEVKGILKDSISNALVSRFGAEIMNTVLEDGKTTVLDSFLKNGFNDGMKSLETAMKQAGNDATKEGMLQTIKKDINEKELIENSINYARNLPGSIMNYIKNTPVANFFNDLSKVFSKDSKLTLGGFLKSRGSGIWEAMTATAKNQFGMGFGFSDLFGVGLGWGTRSKNIGFFMLHNSLGMINSGKHMLKFIACGNEFAKDVLKPLRDYLNANPSVLFSSQMAGFCDILMHGLGDGERGFTDTGIEDMIDSFKMGAVFYWTLPFVSAAVSGLLSGSEESLAKATGLIGEDVSKIAEEEVAEGAGRISNKIASLKERFSFSSEESIMSNGNILSPAEKSLSIKERIVNTVNKVKDTTENIFIMGASNKFSFKIGPIDGIVIATILMAALKGAPRMASVEKNENVAEAIEEYGKEYESGNFDKTNELLARENIEIKGDAIIIDGLRFEVPEGYRGKGEAVVFATSVRRAGFVEKFVDAETTNEKTTTLETEFVNELFKSVDWKNSFDLSDIAGIKQALPVLETALTKSIDAIETLDNLVKEKNISTRGNALGTLELAENFERSGVRESINININSANDVYNNVFKNDGILSKKIINHETQVSILKYGEVIDGKFEFNTESLMSDLSKESTAETAFDDLINILSLSKISPDIYNKMGIESIEDLIIKDYAVMENGELNVKETTRKITEEFNNGNKEALDTLKKLVSLSAVSAKIYESFKPSEIVEGMDFKSHFDNLKMTESDVNDYLREIYDDVIGIENITFEQFKNQIMDSYLDFEIKSIEEQIETLNNLNELPGSIELRQERQTHIEELENAKKEFERIKDADIYDELFKAIENNDFNELPIEINEGREIVIEGIKENVNNLLEDIKLAKQLDFASSLVELTAIAELNGLESLSTELSAKIKEIKTEMEEDGTIDISRIKMESSIILTRSLGNLDAIIRDFNSAIYNSEMIDLGKVVREQKAELEEDINKAQEQREQERKVILNNLEKEEGVTDKKSAIEYIIEKYENLDLEKINVLVDEFIYKDVTTGEEFTETQQAKNIAELKDKLQKSLEEMKLEDVKNIDYVQEFNKAYNQCVEFDLLKDADAIEAMEKSSSIEKLVEKESYYEGNALTKAGAKLILRKAGIKKITDQVLKDYFKLEKDRYTAKEKLEELKIDNFDIKEIMKNPSEFIDTQIGKNSDLGKSYDKVKRFMGNKQLQTYFATLKVIEFNEARSNAEKLLKNGKGNGKDLNPDQIKALETLKDASIGMQIASNLLSGGKFGLSEVQLDAINGIFEGQIAGKQTRVANILGTGAGKTTIISVLFPALKTLNDYDGKYTITMADIASNVGNLMGRIDGLYGSKYSLKFATSNTVDNIIRADRASGVRSALFMDYTNFGFSMLEESCLLKGNTGKVIGDEVDMSVYLSKVMRSDSGGYATKATVSFFTNLIENKDYEETLNNMKEKLNDTELKTLRDNYKEIDDILKGEKALDEGVIDKFVKDIETVKDANKETDFETELTDLQKDLADLKKNSLDNSKEAVRVILEQQKMSLEGLIKQRTSLLKNELGLSPESKEIIDLAKRIREDQKLAEGLKEIKASDWKLEEILANSLESDLTWTEGIDFGLKTLKEDGKIIKKAMLMTRGELVDLVPGVGFKQIQEARLIKAKALSEENMTALGDKNHSSTAIIDALRDDTSGVIGFTGTYSASAESAMRFDQDNYTPSTELQLNDAKTSYAEKTDGKVKINFQDPYETSLGTTLEILSKINSGEVVIAGVNSQVEIDAIREVGNKLKVNGMDEIAWFDSSMEKTDGEAMAKNKDGKYRCYIGTNEQLGRGIDIQIGKYIENNNLVAEDVKVNLYAVNPHLTYKSALEQLAGRVLGSRFSKQAGTNEAGVCENININFISDKNTIRACKDGSKYDIEQNIEEMRAKDYFSLLEERVYGQAGDGLVRENVEVAKSIGKSMDTVERNANRQYIFNEKQFADRLGERYDTVKDILGKHKKEIGEDFIKFDTVQSSVLGGYIVQALNASDEDKERIIQISGIKEKTGNTDEDVINALIGLQDEGLLATSVNNGYSLYDILMVSRATNTNNSEELENRLKEYEKDGIAGIVSDGGIKNILGNINGRTERFNDFMSDENTQEVIKDLGLDEFGNSENDKMSLSYLVDMMRASSIMGINLLSSEDKLNTITTLAKLLYYSGVNSLNNMNIDNLRMDSTDEYAQSDDKEKAYIYLLLATANMDKDGKYWFGSAESIEQFEDRFINEDEQSWNTGILNSIKTSPVVSPVVTVTAPVVSTVSNVVAPVVSPIVNATTPVVSTVSNVVNQTRFDNNQFSELVSKAEVAQKMLKDINATSKNSVLAKALQEDINAPKKYLEETGHKNSNLYKEFDSDNQVEETSVDSVDDFIAKVIPLIGKTISKENVKEKLKEEGLLSVNGKLTADGKKVLTQILLVLANDNLSVNDMDNTLRPLGKVITTNGKLDLSKLTEVFVELQEEGILGVGVSAEEVFSLLSAKGSAYQWTSIKELKKFVDEYKENGITEDMIANGNLVIEGKNISNMLAQIKELESDKAELLKEKSENSNNIEIDNKIQTVENKLVELKSELNKYVSQQEDGKIFFKTTTVAELNNKLILKEAKIELDTNKTVKDKIAYINRKIAENKENIALAGSLDALLMDNILQDIESKKVTIKEIEKIMSDALETYLRNIEDAGMKQSVKEVFGVTNAKETQIALKALFAVFDKSDDIAKLFGYTNIEDVVSNASRDNIMNKYREMVNELSSKEVVNMGYVSLLTIARDLMSLLCESEDAKLIEAVRTGDVDGITNKLLVSKAVNMNYVVKKTVEKKADGDFVIDLTKVKAAIENPELNKERPEELLKKLAEGIIPNNRKAEIRTALMDLSNIHAIQAAA